MQFPVSLRPLFHRVARAAYGIDVLPSAQADRPALFDTRTSRLLAQRILEARTGGRGTALSRGLPPVRAGDLHAGLLIDRILRLVSSLYVLRVAPDTLQAACRRVEDLVGAGRLAEFLARFSGEFPQDAPRDAPSLLMDLLHLSLAASNPAFLPFSDLFDAESLAGDAAYAGILEALQGFFREKPGFGPEGRDLPALLRSPVEASPRSLRGQLDYIRTHWSDLLGQHMADLLVQLLTAMDLIREEDRLGQWSFTPGPPEAYDYSWMAEEAERFSADRDWMPRVVMAAKNAFVWLDQLSRRHGRAIARLDEIPDGELDRLASWGFTALWLIGVWERSPASRTVKRLTGNPEAEASAYSLFDYQIASALGGWEALEALSRRAARRGIRLASDMVPNHTGIDSAWIRQRPDRFLSLPEPPFPSYTFNGTDLSEDPGIEIRIEDHYYDRSDAAVVFRRRDRGTGETRYIYHGNDGTHMPWNDTAQLDFLNPEVREAVIRTILHVARSFPIIRFDAAMTLTRKHFRRLWFPEPGCGGDIPSRAGAGLAQKDFDRAMPQEFWREVVDRVAREAPDTLLLAEAFWLLEGYFVRTLGMHRVYNSAFMNMLKAEENSKYRTTLKNTLEFDPEVLQRFVNFMSNPDEDTAVAQFGDGDKYFGVCLLLATLPGLPMFAHGQIEGLREKYGMEYRRAYRDESPDQALVDRHERSIFPLLRRRRLFASAARFLLYDFYGQDGRVNEDVFAYSNGDGRERALVAYHNRYAEAGGWIRLSAAFVDKAGGSRRLVRRTLGEGLGLPRKAGAYVIFRDAIGGLEYVRSCLEMHDKGLFLHLRAYGAHAFLDFREVEDRGDGPAERNWERLERKLEGRGVPDMDRALREMVLEPLLAALKAVLCKEGWEAFRSAWASRAKADPSGPVGDRAPDPAPFAGFLEQARAWGLSVPETEAALRGRASRLEAILALPLAEGLEGLLPLLYGWVQVHDLAREEANAGLFDSLLLADALRGFLVQAGMAEADVEDGQRALRIAARHAARHAASGPGELLEDPEVRSLLRVHEFDGKLWFGKEQIELLAAVLEATGAVLAGTGGGAKRTVRPAHATKPGTGRRGAAGAKRAVRPSLIDAARESGYLWDEFRRRLGGETQKQVPPQQ